MAIEFDCSGCGDLFRVADEMAGRKGKCPGCGVVNQIPFAGTAVASTKSRRGSGDAESFEDEDTPTRSRKKLQKKKGVWPLLLGLTGMGVLLAGCGVGGYFLYGWYFGGGGLSTEMRYLPNDAQVVISIRVDQGNNTDLVKRLRSEARPANSKDDPFDDARYEKDFGIPLSNIDRITLVGSLTSNDKDHEMKIVRTRKAVKGADIKSNMENHSFEETRLDGYTIYQSTSAYHDSYCVAEDGIVLYGQHSTLKRVLDRGKKPELPEAMETALKNADFGKTQAFAINLKDAMKTDKVGPNGKRPIQELSALLAGFLSKDPAVAKEKAEQMEKVLGKVESLSGTFDVKADIAAAFILVCKDAGTAEEIKKILDAGIGVARDNLKEIKEEVSKEILTEAAGNVSFGQNGNTVTARFTLSGNSLVKYAKQAAEKSVPDADRQNKLPPPPVVPVAPKGPGGPKKGP